MFEQMMQSMPSLFQRIMQLRGGGQMPGMGAGPAPNSPMGMQRPMMGPANGGFVPPVMPTQSPITSMPMGPKVMNPGMGGGIGFNPGPMPTQPIAPPPVPTGGMGPSPDALNQLNKKKAMQQVNAGGAMTNR